MNQQDRRTDVGGGSETAAMSVDARPALDDLIARLHREVRTDTEWLRLVADALAAERDRADLLTARAVLAETRLNQILEYAESTYTTSTVARQIVRMGKATA